MFDSTVQELDPERCLAAFEANERAVVESSCRRLVLAAQWADLHSGAGVSELRVPGSETPWRPGGEGTPSVAGFAAAELGCALGSSAGAGMRLIGDALDLRHRLPLIWRRVLAGEVAGHLARRVAHDTHLLSVEAAALVDAEIAPKLSVLSFGRLISCVEAAVLKADPAAAEAAAKQAMQERFVRLGRGSEFGLKLIIARAAAGDALYLDAMLARLAEILAERGDTDSVEVRRSKALGILARPAEALKLLYDHAEPEPGPASEPDAGYRSVPDVAPPFDPARARPRATIYVHLSEEALSGVRFASGRGVGRGVGRMERVGPVLLSQLRDLLGDGVAITVRPVIDLNEQPAPVDAYEVPDRFREQLLLTDPADRFPFAAGLARNPDGSGVGCDFDHTVAYRSMREGGPPGQTRVEQLGPLVRFHHRLRTHGRWKVRQPEPGTYLWRSPRGRIYLVNRTGTHWLGAGSFAHALWRQAAPATDQVLAC